MKVVQSDRLYQPAIGMNQNCTGEYGDKDMLDVAVTIATFNIIQSQNVKQAKSKPEDLGNSGLRFNRIELDNFD